MKNYDDLSFTQKVVFDKIEEIFINHNSVDVVDFVLVLGMLITKYKIKKNKFN